MKFSSGLFAVLVPFAAGAAEHTLAEMDRLAKDSHQRDGAYEMKAAKSFFGDGSALRMCVSPDGPGPAASVVYPKPTETYVAEIKCSIK